ncbi:unnamed protein product [Brassica rapa]|uniref:Uncharacterized protein n=3 Tax=Brassica TaxID=3705 RepID=A0A8D9GDT5_BRACM|nr:unnamed protein product [Brassica napus]CAG7877411.1 unnamed protein product [Brassica rapa]
MEYYFSFNMIVILVILISYTYHHDCNPTKLGVFVNFYGNTINISQTSQFFIGS